MRLLTCVTAAAVFAASAAAHASLKFPCPRYSPFGQDCPPIPAGQSADSGINAPISSMTLGEKKPLCKYTTPFGSPSATWTAGQSVTVSFHDNIAAHSGGHGQFSISYDSGQTFAVLHEVLRYMFIGSKPSGLTNTASVMSYTFTLPQDLPSSDKAVFSWSWVNASGNREFYMNCADVAIKGGSSSSYTGKEMTIANYPGYPSIPEFNGNYDTGIDLYSGAKQITVGPSGGSGTGTTGNYTSPNPATGSTAPASPGQPSPAQSSMDQSLPSQGAPVPSFGQGSSISSPAQDSATPMSAVQGASAPATTPLGTVVPTAPVQGPAAPTSSAPAYMQPSNTQAY